MNEERERRIPFLIFGCREHCFGQSGWKAEIKTQNWAGCPIFKSARADCKKRPSGWFPRANFWNSQIPAGGPSQDGKEAPNGSLFGPQIEWNKSLDWITFRALRNGEVRSSKLGGTQIEVSLIAIYAQKPKTKLVANVLPCYKTSLAFIKHADYGNTKLRIFRVATSQVQCLHKNPTQSDIHNNLIESILF